MVWHSCIVVNSKNHFCQREEGEEMMKRRRHKPGRSVTLLQHAWGPHWGGSVHHRSQTWKVYSALIRGGRDAIRYQFLISLFPFFVFIHKHNPSRLLPVLETIAFYCFIKTNKQLTVPQNSEVSCHLCVALYDTLKLKIKFSLSYFRLYQCNWWKFVYSVYFTCTPKKIPVISIQISVVA